MASPSEQTLLVTGVNGFLAERAVAEALRRGYYVRGSVRTESSLERVRSHFKEHGDKLSLCVVADITKVELYEVAFANPPKPITGVVNMAAPFVLQVEDNTRDLLDPTIKGAVAILEAIERYGPSVRRIVWTSSFASVVDTTKGYRAGYTYSEKDWNPVSFDEAVAADGVTAYCASKSLAEKAIWDYMERRKPHFDAVTICAPWIFGQYYGANPDLKHLNTSMNLIWNLVGADKVPPIDFAGFVDSRTVVDAHLNALEKPNAGGQRFLVGSRFDYQSAVDILREQFPELRDRLPVGEPGSGKYAEVYDMDGSLAVKELGIEYIPLERTMKDSMQQLLQAEAMAH